MNLFSELKRRNVFRVAAMYAVVGWLIIQVIGSVAEPLGFPDWIVSFVIVIVGLGFPLALVFAWAFELTPDGLKKTKDVDPNHSVAKETGGKLNFAIIGALILGIGYLLYDRMNVPEVSIEQNPTQEGLVSLAVLPFVDLSQDKDQEYFSDGISEELLNVLMRLDGFRVPSRTSSFVYKGANLNIPQIAQELNVGHVLEGSIRKSGNTIRVTAQLIDAQIDQHIWSETYDRELTDIFAIQDEIANSIVTTLRRELGLEVETNISIKAETQNMSAYDLFLQGRDLFIRRENLHGSIEILEKAVELDPNFAKAHEALAAVFAIMPSWNYRERDYLTLSNTHADIAMELDPDLTFPKGIKGGNSLYDLSSERTIGIDLYTEAIEADPKNATLLMWRGLEFLYMGYIDKARKDFEDCLKIDSQYSQCIMYTGIIEVFEGNDGVGLEYYERITDIGHQANSTAFLKPLLDSGNRIAALLSASYNIAIPNAPIGIWIDAIGNSNRDKESGLAIWEEFLKRNNGSLFVYNIIYMDFGAYDKIKLDEFGENFAFWNPKNKGFLETENFKSIIRELGYYGFWKARGFPPQCKPIGEDDFECGEVQ